MAKLLRSLTIQVRDSKRILTFPDTAALSSWATRERDFWMVDPNMVDQSLAQIQRTQSDYFQNIINWAQQLESWALNDDANSVQQQNQLLGTIESHLSHLSSGVFLTTECKQHRELSRLRKSDQGAFVLLTAASRANARENFQNLNGQSVTLALAKSLGLRGQDSPDADFYRDELASLKNNYDSDIQALRSDSESLRELINASKQDEITASGNRESNWIEKRGEIEREWADLKKIFAEQVALAAPTTYWAARASQSGDLAIRYAGAFASAIGVSLVVFFFVAVPYLHEVAKPDISPITAALPVLIPAFAIIWILRILGRLLSESLQLARDAREREVMVKTFLALMNDQATGKALVSDDDRLLILHSLFRPSSITGTDDSPPVHWFDILKRKYGQSA